MRGPTVDFGQVRVAITRSARTDVLVTARFIGYRGIDRATADLLTGADPALPMGCGVVPAPAPLADLAQLVPDPQQGRLEHLDAGDLTVLIDGIAIGASASRRPALAPYVAGLEYDDQAAAIPIGRGEVMIASNGGGRIGAFDAVLTLPPASDGHATWRDDGLEIAWTPDPVGVADTIITIAPDRGAAAIVCRTADSGALHLDLATLARSAGIAPGTEVPITVDRARRVTQSVSGLADLTLELVARDVLTATAP